MTASIHLTGEGHRPLVPPLRPPLHPPPPPPLQEACPGGVFTCLSRGGGGGGEQEEDTQEACPGGCLRACPGWEDTQEACPAWGVLTRLSRGRDIYNKLVLGGYLSVCPGGKGNNKVNCPLWVCVNR